MNKKSQVKSFYRLSVNERTKYVKNFARLTNQEIEALQYPTSVKLELADRMIENVIGVFPLPLGIATNFLVNGRDYLIPMATEQPSVVTAVDYAAMLARKNGGFSASSTDSIMIGQVQLVKAPRPYKACETILSKKAEILAKANEEHRSVKAVDLKARILQAKTGPMVITELFVDCRDVMGANVVDTMAEAVAPLIERITHGKVNVRIVSNLATGRLASAHVALTEETLSGNEVIDDIIRAYVFACEDPYFAVTYNKSVMDGITPLVLATANDTRAVNAGAHAYTAISGNYKPLSTWEKNENGDLVGSIELPMAVGIVGGTTRAHPIANIALKILRVKSARELAEVVATVGLAHNLASLLTWVKRRKNYNI